jgi:hypothetical protein
MRRQGIETILARCGYPLEQSVFTSDDEYIQEFNRYTGKIYYKGWWDYQADLDQRRKYGLKQSIR